MQKKRENIYHQNNMNTEDSNIVAFYDGTQFLITPAIGITKESGVCRFVFAWFCWVVSFKL